VTVPLVCGHCGFSGWVYVHVRRTDGTQVIVCKQCSRVLIDEREEERTDERT
jgi:transcription elongation factor Elf1